MEALGECVPGFLRTIIDIVLDNLRLIMHQNLRHNYYNQFQQSLFYTIFKPDDYFEITFIVLTIFSYLVL